MLAYKPRFAKAAPHASKLAAVKERAFERDGVLP
jgi:hypothetical protein